MADQPIATTAEITGVRLQVQANDPGSGYDTGGAHDHGVLYPKSGGVYYRFPDGSIVGPFSSGSGDPILIEDHKTTGTAGGGFTSGSYVTRDLNTVVTNVGGHASLSGNQITLAAGTYILNASAPAFKCDQHQIRWYNITDSAIAKEGSSEYANNSNSLQSRSVITEFEFTIASSKVFELQHQCAVTQASNGLGVLNSFGSYMVYAQVALRKVA